MSQTSKFAFSVQKITFKPELILCHFWFYLILVVCRTDKISNIFVLFS